MQEPTRRDGSKQCKLLSSRGKDWKNKQEGTFGTQHTQRNQNGSVKAINFALRQKQTAPVQLNKT